MRGQDTDWRVPRDKLVVEYPPTCLCRKRINWREAGPCVPRCVQFSRIITMANIWKCLVIGFPESLTRAKYNVIQESPGSETVISGGQWDSGLQRPGLLASCARAWESSGQLYHGVREGLASPGLIHLWLGAGLTTTTCSLSTKPTDITGGWISCLRHPLKKA